MTTRATEPRTGVTLIEMLVVMAIITALGALALMLLPGISNSDAALKGTEEVRAQVKIAQALAGAARQPRGVRFLTGNINTGTPLPNNATVATELQLIESPPVAALDPLALSLATTQSDGAAGQARVNGAPYVELLYELVPSPPPSGQIAGAISRRHCYIVGLTDAAQRAQIEAGALLYLPTLGAWSRITGRIDPAANPPAPYPPHPAGRPVIEVILNVYPDGAMGASTAHRTYHAGIYGTPIPLLGVPTIPLPKNIGVDLEVSIPSIRDVQLPALTWIPPALPPAVPAPPGVPYDLLFAPDGQTVLIGRNFNNTGVYLWVRDVTKVVNPNGPAGAAQYSMLRNYYAPPVPTPPGATPPSIDYYNGFRRGGEHHAVGINNGALGVAPIQWPEANGALTDPFLFARRKTN